MENNSNQNENKPRRRYKIEVGDELMVYKNEFNGKAFYKVLLKKKMIDDSVEYFYKRIKFKKEVKLDNKTRIRVLDFFEDVDPNKKNKYEPFWTIFITKFDVLEPYVSNDIYYNTQKEMNGIVATDIDKDYEELDKITEEDLPF